jgi:hypothetical protein
LGVDEVNDFEEALDEALDTLEVNEADDCEVTKDARDRDVL